MRDAIVKTTVEPEVTTVETVADAPATVTTNVDVEAVVALNAPL